MTSVLHGTLVAQMWKTLPAVNRLSLGRQDRHKLNNTGYSNPPFLDCTGSAVQIVLTAEQWHFIATDEILIFTHIFLTLLPSPLLGERGWG